MKITMIGAGYVGLVTGVCLSDFGHHVTCVDKNEAAIASLLDGKTPFFEPGLDAMIARNTDEERLSFTTDGAAAVKEADAVFIAVGTPTREGGREANLDFVYAAAREVCEHLEDNKTIVIKSTVPVGTNEEVARIVDEVRPGSGINVVSNPEFLREGSAIEDFLRPDRVVIGVSSPAAEDVMRRLYRPLSLRDTPMVVTDLPTAELIKYAGNAFLAVKITFINEIANLCEQVGANVQQVAAGIGLDGRIGGKFLHPGPGFGGSCFPKDTRALTAIGSKAGATQHLVETVVKVNEHRKLDMAEKIAAALGGDVNGKRIGVLGLAFKPNTDDMRESPSLTILPTLIAQGASVCAFDPEAMGNAKALLPDVEMAASAYEACVNADAVVLLTEWNAFRAMDLNRLAASMRGKELIDLRNVWTLEEVAESPLNYTSVGRPKV